MFVGVTFDPCADGVQGAIILSETREDVFMKMVGLVDHLNEKRIDGEVIEYEWVSKENSLVYYPTDIDPNDSFVHWGEVWEMRPGQVLVFDETQTVNN